MNFWKFSSRYRLPVSAFCSSQIGRYVTSCEESVENKSPSSSDVSVASADEKKPFKAGMQADAEGDFHGLFPMRQLWQPKVDYPLWDSDWDGRKMPSTGDSEKDAANARRIRKTGITKHIILVRHGQYDETSKEDEKRILTPLGRQQAELTGKRLAEMIKGADNNFDPCNIKVVRVSDLTRAKETAEIIASQIKEVPLVEPDANLNEGRPSHHIPGGKASERTVDEHHPRIEASFEKYFHRADAPSLDLKEVPPVEQRHEYEIIVCHANVIRYFLMRALQLPPEAWLRLCPFNCSLTYVTIRPTGTVSCRMMGDIGHLPYDHSTFSMHHGYNW